MTDTRPVFQLALIAAACLVNLLAQVRSFVTKAPLNFDWLQHSALALLPP